MRERERERERESRERERERERENMINKKVKSSKAKKSHFEPKCLRRNVEKYS